MKNIIFIYLVSVFAALSLNAAFSEDTSIKCNAEGKPLSGFASQLRIQPGSQMSAVGGKLLKGAVFSSPTAGAVNGVEFIPDLSLFDLNDRSTSSSVAYVAHALGTSKITGFTSFRRGAVLGKGKNIVDDLSAGSSGANEESMIFLLPQGFSKLSSFKAIGHYENDFNQSFSDLYNCSK